MFAKHYDVDESHIDFQGVVDGLYYPFYMEWTRHAYMREALGIDIEEEFSQGKIYMVLEYTLQNEKRNRVNFVQQIRVDGVVYAEATFVATCLANGRPSMPEAVTRALGL